MDMLANLKLGEVNNLSDARYGAGAGATYLGFCLSPSHERYIAPEKIKNILSWVEGIIPVVEWHDQSIEEVSGICRDLNINHIQLHHCDPDCSLALSGYTLIQNFILDANDDTANVINHLDHVQRYTKYYMLSFENPIAQEAYLQMPAHQLFIKEICRDYPLFLNFHFTPQNIIPLIEDYHPYGINLKGGNEDKPGYKDFDHLDTLIQLMVNGE